MKGSTTLSAAAVAAAASNALPPLRQQLGAGLRGQRMGGRDDAVQRRDCWTLAMHAAACQFSKG